MSGFLVLICCPSAGSLRQAQGIAGHRRVKFVDLLRVRRAKEKVRRKKSQMGWVFFLFFLLDKKERKNQAQTMLSPRAQKTMKTQAK
jgi:hypothetical protein